MLLATLKAGYYSRSGNKSISHAKLSFVFGGRLISCVVSGGTIETDVSAELLFCWSCVNSEKFVLKRKS